MTSKPKAKKFMNYMYIYASSWTTIQIILVLIYTIKNENFAMSTVFIASYTILLVSFAAIFIYLYASTLKRTRDFNEMKEQNKDILIQFLVFMFGIVVKIILSHLMIMYTEDV